MKTVQIDTVTLEAVAKLLCKQGDQMRLAEFVNVLITEKRPIDYSFLSHLSVDDQEAMWPKLILNGYKANDAAWRYECV